MDGLNRRAQAKARRPLKSPFLWQPLVLWCALLGTLWMFPRAAPVAYLALALYALRGPRQTIQALTVLMVLLLGNSAIVPGGAKALRWVVLAAGAGRAVHDSGSSRAFPRRITSAVLLLSGSLAALAVLSSQMPLVSLMKVIAFTMGAGTILVSYHRTRMDCAYWAAWFRTLFLFIGVMSVLALAAGYGYEVNQRGFQGILVHPQTMGPVAAVMAAWFAGRLVFSADRSLLTFGLAACGWLLVYLSQARNGALAAGAGFAVAGLLFFVLRRRLSDGPLHASNIVLILAISAVSVVQFARVESLFREFVAKGDEAQTMVQLFEMSRGDLMAISMQNFYDAPVFGIGLGVPSDYDRVVHRAQYLLGIPISVPVEKGFLPTAVLEETGVVGALLTLALICTLFGPILRYGTFPEAWVAFTAVLMNVGEAVFFSVGGLGLFMWLVLGYAWVNASARSRQFRPPPSANLVPVDARS